MRVFRFFSLVLLSREREETGEEIRIRFEIRSCSVDRARSIASNFTFPVNYSNAKIGRKTVIARSRQRIAIDPFNSMQSSVNFVWPL